MRVLANHVAAVCMHHIQYIRRTLHERAHSSLWASAVNTLQRPLLRMSPTARDEMLRGRNPENARCRGFGRRWHRQSGFQYTYRQQPSSPELFNKNITPAMKALVISVKKYIWKILVYPFYLNTLNLIKIKKIDFNIHYDLISYV